MPVDLVRARRPADAPGAPRPCDDLLGAARDLDEALLAVGPDTSAIGVETTGTPAARNSGVLVGLMNRVASLSANGMKPTSQPAR